MDPISLGVVLVPLLEHFGKRLIDRWMEKPTSQNGLLINSQSQVQSISKTSGTASIAELVPNRTRLPYATKVTVSGDFWLDDSVSYLQDEPFPYLILIAEDQPDGQVSLLDFDRNGYAIEVWPGAYHLYVIVPDPEELDESRLSILAVGYPIGTGDNPNPILIRGDEPLVQIDLLVKEHSRLAREFEALLTPSGEETDEPADEADEEEEEEYADEEEEEEQATTTHARLVLTNGRANITSVELAYGVVTIGRETGNTLVIDDSSVSRQHARVSFENGAWVIQDLNSSNGTFVNDIRVVRQVLRPGDRILMGQSRLVFQS